MKNENHNTKSKELFERSLKVSPGGVHSPVRAFKSVGGQPLFFSSAEGAWLTSVDGDRYIDFCQSFGPNILGHRDPEVTEAVLETQSKAWSLGTCEPYSLELAEWIVSHVPMVEKIRFVCSGTEAVMSALRLARAATGRTKVVKFAGCYHGHVDSMLVKAGSGLAGAAASDSAGVSEDTAQQTLVVDLDNDEQVKRVFDEHGSDIAALIIEPLPANFGLLIQRQEFLKQTFACARAAGALVIFDEVISGFRVALGGMAEILDEQPDLVTYGKIIGGGFPVGAYGGRADLMDLIAPNGPVYQAGTLAANPIGMSAGLATLKKVKREGVYQTLASRMQTFIQNLQRFFVDQNIPLEVTHQASLWWLHKKSEQPIRSLTGFSKDHAEVFARLFQAALQRGLYLAPSGYEVSFTSLAHNEDILEQSQQILMAAAKAAYA